MNAMQTKLSNLKTEQLKEIALNLNNDLSDDAMIVIDEVENVLLERMNELEFVEFMNLLDSKMEGWYGC